MAEFITYETLDDLDDESGLLVHKALDATAHSYAPYSKFFVGAAILMEDGTLVTGTNQENAAYPSGMCAERVALYTMAAKYPGGVVKKMAVVARRDASGSPTPATPCGGCRQVMLEFELRQPNPFPVVMMAETGQWIIAPTASALLPYSFTKHGLEHDPKD